MSALFSPLKIGTLEVKNRFVRSATHDWLGNEDGTISAGQLALYQKLAANDVGLIISGHAYVEHPRGRAGLKQNGIYDDKFIEGYHELSNIAKRYNAKLFVQISHAGVQTTVELTEGIALADPNLLSCEEIKGLIENFAKAAYRVKLAGCDGVQLHMAHGYLLSRFLSPAANRRKDEWGGSVENRSKIAVEIVTRVRELVGADFPLIVKLNSEGGFDGTARIPLEDVVYIAGILKQAGIDGIEVSGGVVGEAKNSMSRVGISSPEQEAYFASAARKIKEAVDIPVILVGGLRSIGVMEKILDEKTADMVSLCRPFIREPELVKKLPVQKAVKCVSCNKCRDINGIRCIFER